MAYRNGGNDNDNDNDNKGKGKGKEKGKKKKPSWGGSGVIPRNKDYAASD